MRSINARLGALVASAGVEDPGFDTDELGDQFMMDAVELMLSEARAMRESEDDYEGDDEDELFARYA